MVYEEESESESERQCLRATVVSVLSLRIESKNVPFARATESVQATVRKNIGQIQLTFIVQRRTERQIARLSIERKISANKFKGFLKKLPNPLRDLRDNRGFKIRIALRR